jgi:hypothetical protein
MTNNIINLRGHHLLTLYRLINSPQNQMNTIVNAHGYRQAQFVQEVLSRLNEKDTLVKVIAGGDIFCQQCPTYDPNECNSNQILTDDYVDARMLGLKIGETYFGKEILFAITKIELRAPSIIGKMPDSVFWMDYSQERPNFSEYNY